MLRVAKQKLMTLLKDDSGIAVAYTIVVFLVLFMFCVSVYAVSENIRQKIILQNACDAAAYSGAVVQADMLSRIAVLNRALSWTYFHTGRRQMDYIIDKWLDGAVAFHAGDIPLVTAWGEASTCPYHARGVNHDTGVISAGVSYYASADHGHPIASNQWTIRFNGNGSFSQAAINADRAGLQDGPWTNLAINRIDPGWRNIQILNAEILYLVNNMNTFINDAVRDTIQRNISIDPQLNTSYNLFFDGNDFDGSNNITPIASYLTPLHSANDGRNLLQHEQDFFDYANGYDSMHTGQNTWWPLQQNNNVNGFQRSYADVLWATYDVYAEKWIYVPPTMYNKDYCILYLYNDTRQAARRNALRAETYRDNYFTSAVATPYQLNRNFWGQAGSIVVTAGEDSYNPFQGAFGVNDVNTGIYSAFNITNRVIAVSAARAGIKFADMAPGEYLVQWPGNRIADTTHYTNGVWNLCEENWDAVLLPLGRAWDNTNVNSWGGASNPTNLLQSVTGLTLNFNGNVFH